MTIQPARKVQIVLLLVKKVTVAAKYLDFADIFSEELANVLLERIKANKYTIKLEQSKQLSYRLIYSSRPIELKILKTYIEINLANDIIKA